MKARTPTPLFDQALTAPLRALTPTPLPEGEGTSGAYAPLLPPGRRWLDATSERVADESAG